VPFVGGYFKGEKMKLKVLFKTPDVVDYALEDLNGDDYNKAKELMKRYIKYGELITIEFDTEEHTAKVVEV
jgi:hypothetical protein